MRAVFAGAKDKEVSGYRFVLVLNCKSPSGAAEPISVASVTPHRVFNRGAARTSRVWHVELEIQTLLVPPPHQGRGVGTVMQRAMYVLAQSLAAEPDPPAYDDDGPSPAGHWRATGSAWVGRRIARRALGPEGGDVGVVRGVVEAWLPADASGFVDASGAAAPLWRVRYTSSGPLEGELEDLEEFELLGSVPAMGALDSGGLDSGGLDRVQQLDAEEATKISMERITCVTTVYLDNMARKFYLKNDMKEMLPPYDDGNRRGSRGGAGCAERQRIWDNCDHKRLHWWFNVIYGSSFKGDETPEQGLENAIANTVASCKRGAATVHPT